MKRFVILAASIAAFVLFPVLLSCKASRPEYKEILPEDISVIGEHPRLLLRKGGEQELCDKIARNPFLQEVHDAIIRWSDSFLEEDPMTPDLINGRLLPKSRMMLMRVFYLSYSYRMTGDEKYARCAESMMRNVSGFKSWNPKNALDPAEMLMALAIGYDWLYDYLSEDTKTMVREAMRTKAIDNTLPEKCKVPKYMKWLKNHTNINAVCNSAIAAAGMAMFEACPDYSRRVICRSINNARTHTMTEYSPDGNYPEGYMYWNYGTSYLVLFQEMLAGATGIDLGLEHAPGFLQSGKYMLHMTMQDLGCYAYSDCNMSEYQLAVPLFWIASMTGDSSVLYRQMERVESLRKEGDIMKILESRYLPAVILWGPEGETAYTPEPPRERMFVGQGVTPVALIRNHFGGDDEIFMGLKCGADSSNHSHMDVGSFVMSRGRDNWFVELPHQDYYSVLKYGVDLFNRSQYSPRWTVFRCGMYSHNLIVFSDSLQRVDRKAFIDKARDKKGFVGVASDLTSIQGVPLKSYWRGIAIVDDDIAVVRDEVETSTSSVDLRWAAVTMADVEKVDRSTVIMRMNGHSVCVTLEGADAEFETFSTDPVHYYDLPNPGTRLLGFRYTVPASSRVSFTVRVMPVEKMTVRRRRIKDISRW